MRKKTWFKVILGSTVDSWRPTVDCQNSRNKKMECIGSSGILPWRVDSWGPTVDSRKPTVDSWRPTVDCQNSRNKEMKCIGSRGIFPRTVDCWDPTVDCRGICRLMLNCKGADLGHCFGHEDEGFGFRCQHESCRTHGILGGIKISAQSDKRQRNYGPTKLVKNHRNAKLKFYRFGTELRSSHTNAYQMNIDDQENI